MSKSQILKQIILQLWYYVIAYFSHYLFPKIKEAFINSKEHFIAYLWDSIKEDIHAQIKIVTEGVNIFFESASYLDKERMVIDILFNKIKLPAYLKIFKPLLKKILRNKLHNLIKDYLIKATAKLNELV